MLLSLIRHAEPNWEPTSGRAVNDAPISARGIGQSLDLAALVDNMGVTHLFCSTMVRARETATRLLAFGETLETCDTRDWLRELGAPARWEGTTVKVAEAELAMMRRMRLDDMAYGFEGGENFAAFQIRVEQGLRELLFDIAGVERSGIDGRCWVKNPPQGRQHIMLVTHSGVIGQILAILLNQQGVSYGGSTYGGLWNWWTLCPDFASVTTLRLEPLGGPVEHMWCLKSFNRVN